MKKIFAFVLAMLMVLSIVPASAFAAFGEACPTTHTMINCENVFVKTIPATCTEYGYDIYACVKCGAEIYNNLTDYAEHPWVTGADKNHTDKAATCTDPGYKWVKKCGACNQWETVEGLSECDGSCGVENCQLYKLVVTATHNYVATGTGIGCETEYKCSVCKKIMYKNAAGDYVSSNPHTWDYANAVVTEQAAWVNGTFKAGKATVSCSVEGCPGEKEIDITSMTCQHYAATIVKAAAEATCFAEGSQQILECRDCKFYYIDENVDGEIGDNELKLVVIKDNARQEDQPTKDLSYAVIEKLEHSMADDDKYISHEDCVAVYKCQHCETIQSKVDHLKPVDLSPEKIDFEASCLNVGYDFQYCEACQTNITVVIEPKGHDEKTITVAPTCVNKGATYTICIRSNCTLAGREIVDADSESEVADILINDYKIDAKFIEDRTEGDGKVYTLKYISEKDVKEVDTDAHSLVYSDATTGEIIETEDGKKPVATCLGFIILKTECAYGCDANTIEFLKAGEHDNYVYQKYANCNKVTTGHSAGPKLEEFTERIVYKCSDCGTVTYEDNTVQFSNEYATAEDLKYYHGAIYYEANPEDTSKLVEKPRKNNVTDYEIYKEKPTCTKTGLYTYSCSDCNMFFYVTAPTIDHSPSKTRGPQDSDYVGGEEASCTTAGKWDSFKCAYCNQLIIQDMYNSNKQKVVTSLVIKPHGDKLVKTRKVTTSTEKYCSDAYYWQCTECPATFTDNTASEKYDTSKENHNWYIAQKKVVANCNTTGKYEIKYCKNINCARYEVNAFYEIEGKEYEVLVYAGKRSVKNASKGTYNKTTVNGKIYALSKGKLAAKNFTIEANGKLGGDYKVDLPMINHNTALFVGSKYQGNLEAALKDILALDKKDGKADGFITVTVSSTGDHTSPSFTSKQCVFCEHEYFSDYYAFSKDHVNVSGQVIPTDCSINSVDDRFCIYCDHIVSGTHKWTSENAMHVDPTCSADGYDYKLCEICGYRNIIKKYAKSDDYHTTEAFELYHKVENGQQSNYAVVGSEYSVSCALCKKNLGLAQKPDEIKTNGFEILLNADATTFIPGSTVKVTVSLASLKGVNVWALAFPVNYDANIFDFVGYEWNTESAFQGTATEVAGGYKPITRYASAYGVLTDGLYVPSGIISIVANAFEGELIKEEETLLTLEFKVISVDTAATTFYVEEADCVIGGVVGQSMLELHGNKKDPSDPAGEALLKDNYIFMRDIAPLYALVKEATPKTFKVEALDEFGKEVSVNFNGKNSTEVLEVAAFLDLTDDDNDDITLADAYALYSIIYNRGYDVKADANFDGFVDGKDLTILYAIYSGVITVEQLITPDAELPEGWFAGLGGR